MIPYLIALVGGFLIGDSIKSEIFADGGEADSVAITILKQLGGVGRLRAMTGAYNFVDLGDGVAFKIKNQRANYIKIKLNGKDLYDLEVGRIRGTTYKVVATHNDVYFDQLKPLIEKATGMYLSLFANGGQTMETGIFKNLLDFDVELESVKSKEIIIELKLEFKRYREEKYYFEYGIDWGDVYLYKVKDEKGQEVSREKENELEKKFGYYLDEKLRDAYDILEERRRDDETDYDDYYADGGEIKPNPDDIKVGDLVMVNAEVVRNEGNIFTALKDIKGIVKEKSGSVYVVQKVDRKGDMVPGNKGYIGTFGRGVRKA